MNRIYQTVSPAKPGYSRFDLSYDKKLTCDGGELIPFFVDETIPGDIWKIGVSAVVRMNPLVAPILHRVRVYFHYFVAPIRLLWSSWETFITGGVLGTDATALPRWAPSGYAKGSLWDYLEMPVGVAPDADNRPLDFPKRAYNAIYNQYYRDETLITELAIDSAEAVQKRAWTKDFFTSALPWVLRGSAPALPVSLSGVINVAPRDIDITMKNESDATSRTMRLLVTSGYLASSAAPSGTADARWVEPALQVDLAGGAATSFSISDLRLALQLQRFMERNARAGVRYNEVITSHFGNVAAKDERLQRPEYIGGTVCEMISSEVLQTSATGLTGGSTPQGNLAGHGIAVARDFCASYRSVEHGIIMGIMSIMPDPVYQQGIDRKWLRKTRYDYYWPEFANLSEQAIQRVELYANGVKGDNETIFGYQGRYDEYRQNRSKVCGDFVDTMDHWHMSRQFGSAPTLNQTFIECVPRKDCFAAPSVDGFLCNIGNLVTCTRPMPLQSEPGIQL